MIRRYVLVALAVTLLTGAGLIGRALRAEDPPFTATGDVHMVTSPDGFTTAVSIDVGDTKRPPDGLVDHAFRLQHSTVQALAYDGPGTVTYANHQLSLGTDGDVGWVMSVEGAVASLGDRDLSYAWLTVSGLSHHWAGKIHRSHDDVAGLLLATGCVTDAGDPSCDSCEVGGPGAEGCGVDCDGGSGCSASCSSGMFACCNCPGGCRCCREKETALNGFPRRH